MMRFFILCLVAVHLGVHAEQPNIKFDPKAHDFDIYQIGVGGNVKEARKHAFDQLVQAVANQMMPSVETLASTQHVFKKNQLIYWFNENDFTYVSLERIGNKKYVAGGVRWANLVDKARLILDTFPENLEERSILAVQKLKNRLSLAQVFLNYAEHQGFDHDVRNWNQLNALNRVVDRRLNQGLLIFEGALSGSIIKIDNQLVRLHKQYLTPGLHLFEISRKGSHTTAGQLYISAGEVRRIPIQLADDHPDIWSIRLELTENLVAFQLPIISKLRVLGMGVDNASPQKLRATLKQNTVLQEAYNQQSYKLVIGFYDKHQKILEQTYDFIIFTESGNDDIGEQSVEFFILNAFFSLISQLNFDHEFTVETVTKNLNTAVIIENP